MEIYLKNVKIKMNERGIDVSKEEGFNSFCSELQLLLIYIEWSYSHSDDILTIRLQNITTIPDLSSIGELIE